MKSNLMRRLDWFIIPMDNKVDGDEIKEKVKKKFKLNDLYCKRQMY